MTEGNLIIFNGFVDIFESGKSSGFEDYCFNTLKLKRFKLEEAKEHIEDILNRLNKTTK